MGSSPAGRASPLPTLPDDLVEALGSAWPRVLQLVEPVTLVPVWATVELDRAAASLVIASRSSPILPAPHLGARARVVGLVAGSDPPELVVAEPATEGLLAASLARHGEGWAAVYLRASVAALDRLRAAGLAVSPEAGGPLGPERLLLGHPRTGPFVLIATEAAG